MDAISRSIIILWLLTVSALAQNIRVNTITTTSGLTNNALTANRVLLANANKAIVSGPANAIGALTNDGSGGFGWFDLTILASDTNGVAVSAEHGIGVTTNFTGGKTVYGARSIQFTNVTLNTKEGGTVNILTNLQRVRTFMIADNYLTNFAGQEGGVVSLGVRAGGTNDGHSSVGIVNIGEDAGSNQVLQDSWYVFNGAPASGLNMALTNAFNVLNFGGSAGNSLKGTNVMSILNLGHGAGFDIKLKDCDDVFNCGHYAGGYMHATNTDHINYFGTYAGGGNATSKGSRLTNSQSIWGYGYATLQAAKVFETTNLYAYGTYAASNLVVSGANRIYFYGAYSGEAARLTNSADIYTLGYYALRDAHVADSTNITAIGIDTLEHAHLTNSHNITVIGFEALENAKLSNSINIIILGNTAGTNLAGAYQNVVLIGQGAVPSANSNQIVLGMSGDTNLIRGALEMTALTASTILQADANKKLGSIANGVGALTNNGSGVFGYYDLTSLSSSADSLWTNNTSGNSSVVYLKAYPTNLQIRPLWTNGAMLTLGPYTTNWFDGAFGDPREYYSILSARDVSRGDIERNNFWFSAALDSGNVYGSIDGSARTNFSILTVEAVGMPGGGTRRVQAGYDGSQTLLTVIGETGSTLITDGRMTISSSITNEGTLTNVGLASFGTNVTFYGSRTTNAPSNKYFTARNPDSGAPGATEGIADFSLLSIRTDIVGTTRDNIVYRQGYNANREIPAEASGYETHETAWFTDRAKYEFYFEFVDTNGNSIRPIGYTFNKSNLLTGDQWNTRATTTYLSGENVFIADEQETNIVAQFSDPGLGGGGMSQIFGLLRLSPYTPAGGSATATKMQLFSADSSKIGVIHQDAETLSIAPFSGTAKVLFGSGYTNVTFVNTINAETNLASFDIVTTDFVINTWYTNDNRRASVVVGFELDANTTGTAKAGLYIDQAKDGTFETTLTVQSTAIADPVQHVVTGWLQPNARFAITNLSSGAGSPTVAVVAGSSQWVKQ